MTAGLYIHFPFCQKKCAYCDFYSVEYEDSLVSSFVDSLCREIDLQSSFYDTLELTVDTVYFGGGTPSMLKANRIERLFGRIGRSFPLSGASEITVEVNPGTLSREMLRAYRETGINRLSVGIQSLDDAELRFLGRIHSAREAETLVREAQKLEFRNVGIDLIYAFPGHTIGSWKKTLKKAVSLNPAHVSAYALTWSDKTELGRKIAAGACALPEDDEISEMYLLCHDVLSDAGYEHYEISNFALPGFRCRHNEGYWTGAAYLGLGPSAHSFIAGRRSWNVSDVWAYIDVLSQGRFPGAGEEILDDGQRMLERLALGLRTQEGVAVSSLNGKQDFMADLADAGLAILRNGRLRLTARGFLLADEVAARLAC
jgi:oxygen-independent coproporphyrinogen-3 oxidase